MASRLPAAKSLASQVTATVGKDTASPSALRTGFRLLLHRQLKTIMEKHFITHIQLASNEMINFSCIMASNVCLLFFFFFSFQNQHQKESKTKIPWVQYVMQVN